MSESLEKTWKGVSRMKRMIVGLSCLLVCLAISMPVTARDYSRDYHGHHGYRERPYGHRHYNEYRHKGHRYRYHGHWRSWKDWHDYARERPYIYEHGRYYREGGHLMFRFCAPGTDDCFFFSIGR